ncbi:hypothetical protein GCM10010320_58720 [Streptomyces caelestis]|nr:hypothetical protein GCM10010320_58720 [Streptomyces caelestis]
MTGGRTKGWWDEYRGKIPSDFLDMAELEHHATSLRTLQTAHIPGLFQTEDHARALFDLFVPAWPRLDVELRIAHRLARHAVVANEPGVPYVGLVHEAALRIRIGGHQVAKAQLNRLLEESERPNVRLLVIPTAEGFPMAGDTWCTSPPPVLIWTRSRWTLRWVLSSSTHRPNWPTSADDWTWSNRWR